MYHAIKYPRFQMAAKQKGFGAGDTLVLFGEVFSRGYVNGLIEAAKSKKMNVIYATVGRRDKDEALRPLNAEELAAQPTPLINIPLEAGFDMEKDQNGVRIIDQLREVKLSNWEEFHFTPGSIEAAKHKGRERFQSNLRQYVSELKKLLPAKGNVLFAHLMAGGVPRIKIVMPLMNRIVKGTGDRFLSSEHFIQTSIGKAVLHSFNEVTAETFRFLIQETAELRKELHADDRRVSYLAYGYHGTEVLTGKEYVWQSYSPYIQGWAKRLLENISQDATSHGVSSCVYNCPEILTNSSAIFSGVEVSLYPLMGALKKEGADKPKVESILKECQALLKPEINIEELLKFTREYLTSDLIRSHCDFPSWPQHNTKVQLETMLNASDQLVGYHKDPKNVITQKLSELVFTACGEVMLADSFKPEVPVTWINHDIIAQFFANR